MEQNKNLLRMRKERGLSQAELAAELGITRQTVSRWEAGLASPSAESLIGLSRVFGVPPEELYAGKAPEEPVTLPEEPGPAAEEAAPEADQPKPLRRSVKIGIIILVICVMTGILLWGRLTNSSSVATSQLILISLCLIIAWLIFFSYSAYKHWRNNKDR